jgi:hypothetical protein
MSVKPFAPVATLDANTGECGRHEKTDDRVRDPLAPPRGRGIPFFKLIIFHIDKYFMIEI